MTSREGKAQLLPKVGLDALFRPGRQYPEDKYLPCYPVLAAGSFHIQFATDVQGDNVRIVTAYRPDPNEWKGDLKTRRFQK